MAALMGLSLAACGGSDGGSAGGGDAGDSKPAESTDSGAASSDTANKDKPLVWFNRQPSNSTTGALLQRRYLLCRL